MSKRTLSLRLPPELLRRVETLAASSRLKKTTIVEMAVEQFLPELEKKYEKEIKALDQKASYKVREGGIELNDTHGKKSKP